MRLPFSRKKTPIRECDDAHTVPVLRDTGVKRLKGLSRLSSPVAVFRQKSKGGMVRCLIPGTW